MQSLHPNCLYDVNAGFDLCAAIWCLWPAGCCICMSASLWMRQGCACRLASVFFFFSTHESFLKRLSSWIHLFFGGGGGGFFRSFRTLSCQTSTLVRIQLEKWELKAEIWNLSQPECLTGTEPRQGWFGAGSQLPVTDTGQSTKKHS